MTQIPLLDPTPWDEAVFGIPTWELKEHSEAALIAAQATKGHHTVRVKPLSDTALLARYGFYYCDTLIEPYCKAGDLVAVKRSEATISKDVDGQRALEVCHGAFSHGRFHRDHNLSRDAADNRYDRWLRQLLNDGLVYGLYWNGGLEGFIGCQNDKLLLHALSERMRGKGLAKYWWSAVCEDLYAEGRDEITSSISASNLSVLNLYASLGFRFRQPIDVYHRLTR